MHVLNLAKRAEYDAFAEEFLASMCLENRKPRHKAPRRARWLGPVIIAAGVILVGCAPLLGDSHPTPGASVPTTIQP